MSDPDHIPVLPHHFSLTSISVLTFSREDDHISFLCQATSNIVLPSTIFNSSDIYPPIDDENKIHSDDPSDHSAPNDPSSPVTWQLHTFTWQFRRRYSDFAWLHSHLTPEFSTSELGFALKLPILPEKQWFGNFNRDFITQRKKQLHSYLHELIVQPCIVYYPYFLQFLGCPGEPLHHPANANLLFDTTGVTIPVQLMPTYLLVGIQVLNRNNGL